jgi:hypothetical protein
LQAPGFELAGGDGADFGFGGGAHDYSL